MTPDEYAAAQAVISASVARYVAQFGKFFVNPALGIAEWLRLLELLFPEIQRQRERSADLAREFYDAQRELRHPDLPRNDRLLENYEFHWFAEDMDEARRKMSQEDSPADAVGRLALRAVRAVENGGRRQIIRAVENDPALHIIKGWARVATGRETCAWCLMLISRGPVYLGADTAGLNLDDTTAKRMIAAGEDVSEFMEQWHDGCDCKVVPVFKTEVWPGQAAADRALELWNEATTEASKLIDSGKSRTDNLNREAINALRRRLDSGDISPSEFAGLAA